MYSYEVQFINGDIFKNNEKIIRKIDNVID